MGNPMNLDPTRLERGFCKKEPGPELVLYRGLRWARDGAGFEPVPYCPNCRLPMAGIRHLASLATGRLLGPPTAWKCSRCLLRVDQSTPPESPPTRAG